VVLKESPQVVRRRIISGAEMQVRFAVLPETRGENSSRKAIANELSRDERTMICHFLTRELIASGLEASREPNARGLLMESVIDFINRSNLK